MTKDIPIVSHSLLVDPQTAGPRIQVGTSQWFEWLRQPQNKRFSYALYNLQQGYIDGFMTLRKETRQRGGHYWSAYRRRNRKLCKVYVGTSDALTLNKLEAIARRLRDPPAG